VQTLLSEAEMGELFKVIAMGRGLSDEACGFVRGDRRGAL
jgi:SAM-dependent MidA family methyltransferase